MSKPFEPADIEDIRIIIKAKGKHYSIIPNRDIVNDQEALSLRKNALDAVMNCHKVVNKPLEEL